jgi:dTDP-4-dehydrorhamnose 3,5-epimerase
MRQKRAQEKLGGIFDAYVGGPPAADETGRRVLLRESDNLLGRFGEAAWREIQPGQVLPFTLRAAADRVWLLIEGELWAVMHDTREGTPSRGQTQAVRLDGRPHALLLIPFGVACAPRAIGGGSARMLELASREEDPGAPAQTFAADDPAIGFDWSTLSG